MLCFLKAFTVFLVVAALTMILARLIFAIPVDEGRHDTLALSSQLTG